MKMYAYIYEGVVWEIFQPMVDDQNEEIPLEMQYSPEYLSACVDITDIDPSPMVGWLFDGKKFIAKK
ncbi:hypothetical protein [Burkholderia sp. BCC0097]|uniref:hypothetical protein n=1 Tax=Burkholderia sp. BCC0097 TaxID=2676289 RepID=UPI00158B4D2D|nr:hypothetical protein [Burkholderia sp. BCC0097]